MMVSGDITKDSLSEGNVDPCGVCSLIVWANSFLCMQCGKWIHHRCFGVKRVTIIFWKFCMQKVCREYWNVSGAGSKVM